MPRYVAVLRDKRSDKFAMSGSIDGHALRGSVGLPLVDVEESCQKVSKSDIRNPESFKAGVTYLYPFLP
jgi:hypothetical protein